MDNNFEDQMDEYKDEAEEREKITLDLATYKRDKYISWAISLVIIILMCVSLVAVHCERKAIEDRFPLPPDGSISTDVSGSQPGSSTPAEDVMPHVIGLSATEAVDLIGDGTGKITIRRVDGSTILFLQDFTVVEQSPEAGAALNGDTAVTLTCMSQEELQAGAVG